MPLDGPKELSRAIGQSSLDGKWRLNRTSRERFTEPLERTLSGNHAYQGCQTQTPSIQFVEVLLKIIFRPLSIRELLCIFE